MTNATPDAIFRIATGFMASKHLFAAAGISLFEKLAGGAMTLDELATACGVPRRTVRISADAMLSLGLLEREGARYRNNGTAAFLSGSGPGPDLRPMLRFWDRISYGLWAGLETVWGWYWIVSHPDPAPVRCAIRHLIRVAWRLLGRAHAPSSRT